MAKANATIDHDTIKEWTEKRGGCPACVRGTGRDGDPGILRIDFPGFSGKDSLEPISWQAFFEWFDLNELAFLYQDDANSRFNKLVSRDGVELPKSPKKKSGSSKRIHAVHLLEQQHREVEATLHAYQVSEDPKEKQALMARASDLLAAHSKIEETIFYPALLGKETEDDLREAVEEHLTVKRIIADLLDMDAADPQTDAKMTVLQEAVDHHVEEEEDRLFAIAAELDDAQMRKLGAQMKTDFDRLMKGAPRKSVPGETAEAAPLM